MSELKWVYFPSGRCCTDIESHGGRLVLHAFVGGEWAVTRSNRRGILERGEYIHLTGSAKGEPKGADLNEAMALALASAEAIRDKERPVQEYVQLRIEDAE